MPKLRKAKDGHWYVQAFVHGAGQVGTWQITDEGVEYIRGLGIDEEAIPRWLFADLRDRGWAFTMGSGFGDQVPLDTLPAKGAEKQLKLAIAETDNGWILSILVPELPAELFAQLIGKANQSLLTKCSLQIDGDKEFLPISHLWPGKGGKSWSLDPHEGSYALTLVGPWPSDANLKFLTLPVDGLDPKGSLFFAPDKLGTRVPRGTVVVADSSYYLVVNASYELRPPASVSTRLVGANNNWMAWEIRFPVHPEDDVRRWCARLGMGIEEPRLILEIVTPPPKRMLVTGVPLFEVEEEIVVSATPTNDKVKLDEFALSVSCDGQPQAEISRLRGRRVDEIPYVKFTLHRSGTYQIRAVRGRVAPLTFAVRLHSPATGADKLKSTPAPLSVKIGEKFYTAFSRNADKDQIAVWIARSEKAPAFEIGCPVPIHLEWTSCGIKDHSVVMSSEAVELLTPALAKALAARKPMVIELDAGSFGRLCFRAAPVILKAARNEVGEVTSAILKRARWLAGTVVSLRRQGEPEMEIDSRCQRTLRRLGLLAGCSSLKEIVKVPRTVIHQATALGREVIASQSFTEEMGAADEQRA